MRSYLREVANRAVTRSPLFIAHIPGIALYSLMRDRLIDARRSEFGLAANDIDIARFETKATSIGVQVRAVEAYQKWVAAGLKLKAYEALLELARGRTNGIERQVQLGAKPEILLTENEANLVKRRAFVVEARQDFRVAAVKLSLYYRGADGTPIVVDQARLPTDATALDGIRTDPAFNLEGRPDFAIMLEEIDKVTVKLALARYDLLPRTDLGGEVAKDQGHRADRCRRAEPDASRDDRRRHIQDPAAEPQSQR